MCYSPVPCGTEVIYLRGQFAERLAKGRTSQAWVCLAEIHQVISAVTRLGCSLFIWKFGKLFSGKLPDELMQIITSRAASPNKGLGQQRREHSKGRLCDLLCRFPPEPATEDRKPKEDSLLFLREQLPGMVKDSPHGPVTSG